VIKELATMRFVADGANALLLGPPEVAVMLTKRRTTRRRSYMLRCPNGFAQSQERELQFAP